MSVAQAAGVYPSGHKKGTKTGLHIKKDPKWHKIAEVKFDETFGSIKIEPPEKSPMVHKNPFAHTVAQHLACCDIVTTNDPERLKAYFGAGISKGMKGISSRKSLGRMFRNGRKVAYGLIPKSEAQKKAIAKLVNNAAQYRGGQQPPQLVDYRDARYRLQQHEYNVALGKAHKLEAIAKRKRSKKPVVKKQYQKRQRIPNPNVPSQSYYRQSAPSFWRQGATSDSD